MNVVVGISGVNNMSAYVCSDKQLLILAIAYNARFDNNPIQYLELTQVNKVANVLLSANKRGVRAEYAHRTNKEFLAMFGSFNYKINQVKQAELITLFNTLSYIEIYKLADNLEYQCCAMPTWYSSLAYHILNNIRVKASKSIIQASVEWNNAAWGMNE